jgi:Ferredoxin-dependent bilin reductase
MLDQIARTALRDILAWGATPLAMPPGLGLLEATVREASVRMESQAWHHPHFRLIRLTRLYGRVQMLNFVVYPHAKYEHPIFATDIVLLGEKLRVCYIDAMPLFPDEPSYDARYVAPFAPLHQQSLVLAPRYDVKLDWSHQFVGRAACLATDPPSLVALPAFADLWENYWQTYGKLVEGMQPTNPERAAEVAAWHHHYNHQHAEVEGHRNPIMHYFGQEIGWRYLREFLFSETLGMG